MQKRSALVRQTGVEGTHRTINEINSFHKSDILPNLGLALYAIKSIG
jgi:hypothetical protein